MTLHGVEECSDERYLVDFKTQWEESLQDSQHGIIALT